MSLRSYFSLHQYSGAGKTSGSTWVNSEFMYEWYFLQCIYCIYWFIRNQYLFYWSIIEALVKNTTFDGSVSELPLNIFEIVELSAYNFFLTAAVRTHSEEIKRKSNLDFFIFLFLCKNLGKAWFHGLGIIFLRFCINKNICAVKGASGMKEISKQQ